MISNLRNEQYGCMEKKFHCSDLQPHNTDLAIGDDAAGLSSDISLISYLVTSNHRNTEIVKRKILEYMYKVSKGTVWAPTWVHELVKLDKAVILCYLNSEPTMLSGSFLNIACYVFKLRLIIHTSGMNGYQLLKFGVKEAESHEVILLSRGYFMLKHPSAKLREIANANPFVTCLAYNSNDAYKQADVKQSPTLDSNNPYIANRERFTNPNQCPNNQLRFLYRLLKLTKGTNSKRDIQTGNNYLYPNYKQISDNSKVNFNHKDKRVSNFDNMSLRMKHYKKSKALNGLVEQYSESIKQHGSRLEKLRLNSDEKRNKGGNNTSLEIAIEFITNYHHRLRQFAAEDPESGKYKPSIISKTAHKIEGKLKFYNEINKFGFIKVEQSHDVFLHKESLVRSKINPKAFEQCAAHFEILMRFKVLKYKGKKNINEKAVEIELLNFVPKS